MYVGREWLSDTYSVLDPYAFVFFTWGVRRELRMSELKAYTALKDRMMKRRGRGRKALNNGSSVHGAHKDLGPSVRFGWKAVIRTGLPSVGHQRIEAITLPCKIFEASMVN